MSQAFSVTVGKLTGIFFDAVGGEGSLPWWSTNYRVFENMARDFTGCRVARLAVCAIINTASQISFFARKGLKRKQETARNRNNT